MNDIYGVDPCAPAGAEELITLLRLFGPTEGRFIADFPTGWLASAREALSGEPPVASKRAMEWIRRRRNAVLNVKCRYFPERAWAENARSLTAQAAKMIGPRGCPPTLTQIDEALYSAAGLPDARGGLIPRTCSDYRRIAWPLFAISPKVVLVDPYLRLRHEGRRSRQWAVLKAFLEEAKAQRKVSAISLHVQRSQALAGDPDGGQFEADLEELLDLVGTDNIGFEYVVLDKLQYTDQHARYLLGAGCGIQFDHGFDTAQDGSTNHVHWLSDSEVQPLLKKFDLPEC